MSNSVAMLILPLEDSAITPAIDAESMFHAFIVLSLIGVSFCVFPSAFSLHISRFEVAFIDAFIDLPGVFSSAMKLASPVFSLVSVAVTEQFKALPLLNPIGKVAIVSALVGVKFTSSVIKIIFPESFVPLSVGNEYSEAVLQIILKISFVDIGVGSELNCLSFSLQLSSLHLEVSQIKLTALRPQQRRAPDQFELNSLPCPSHVEPSVLIHIQPQIIEDFVGSLNYFVLAGLN